MLSGEPFRHTWCLHVGTSGDLCLLAASGSSVGGLAIVSGVARPQGPASPGRILPLILHSHQTVQLH